MRIGELADRAGVSVRSLRYYEEQGLLSSTRSASGQRHFVENDVDRVRYLQRLYAAGLSSRTILELLPCTESPSETNSDHAWARMAEERERLETHIADLVRTRDSLDALISANRHHRERMSGAAEPAELRP